MKFYYPYLADDGKHKYFIITNTGNQVYFGAKGYDDYTIHKDDERKLRYIKRHQKKEDWNNPNTAGFWSRWLLWNKPTIAESYKNIKKRIFNY